MTYKEIIKKIKSKHNLSVKTCWIAHVKELNGLPMRGTWHRDGARKDPCPEKYKKYIEEAMGLR